MKNAFILLTVVSLLFGCSTENKINNTEYHRVPNYDFDEDFLIHPIQLNNIINNEDIKIIDARKVLEYGKEHIEGSISISSNQLAFTEGEPGDKDWGNILNLDNLTKVLARKGISKEDDIVIYADKKDGNGEDGRIYWILKCLGFERVKILDGGYTLWDEIGFPKSTEVTNLVSIPKEDLTFNDSSYVSTDILAKFYSQYTLVDTRSKKEYEGKEKFINLRRGKLAGAIHIDFEDFINNNGTMKSKKEIIDIMEGKGISKSDTILLYSNMGVRSTHSYVVLKNCGYKVFNYQDGFYRWSGISSLHVE